MTTSTQSFSGSYGARAVGNGTVSFARYKLPTTRTELYLRSRFKVISKGSNSVYLLRVRDDLNDGVAGVFINSANKLGYRNDVIGKSSYPATLSQGTWYDVQMRVVISGTTALSEVYLNGVKIMTKTDTLGSRPFGYVQMGESYTQRTFDVAFDDVVVDDNFYASPALTFQ